MRILFFVILFFSELHYFAQEYTVSIVTTKDDCNKGSAEAIVAAGAEPYTYLWSNGTTTALNNNLSAGEYWVTIKGMHDRDTTIHTTIEFEECGPVAQSYFTPNDDGYNDTWSISHLELYPDFELNVYNRWGQLVHHQIKEYKPWTAKSLGIIPIADGAYYYILFYDIADRAKFIKGSVSIVR